MSSLHQPYINELKRRKDRYGLTVVEAKASERVMNKYPNKSVILEEGNPRLSEKDYLYTEDMRSEPSSAKPITNIYDPLIQTTPISKPEPLFKRRKAAISGKLEVENKSKNVNPEECNGECFTRIVHKTSEMLLLKFQEVLQTEKMIMLELINKSSNKDDVLYKLANKAEELNRENAILQLENKGLKGMLNSWNK